VSNAGGGARVRRGCGRANRSEKKERGQATRKVPKRDVIPNGVEARMRVHAPFQTAASVRCSKTTLEGEDELR